MLQRKQLNSTWSSWNKYIITFVIRGHICLIHVNIRRSNGVHKSHHISVATYSLMTACRTDACCHYNPVGLQIPVTHTYQRHEKWCFTNKLMLFFKKQKIIKKILNYNWNGQDMCHHLQHDINKDRVSSLKLCHLWLVKSGCNETISHHHDKWQRKISWARWSQHRKCTAWICPPPQIKGAEIQTSKGLKYSRGPSTRVDFAHSPANNKDSRRNWYRETKEIANLSWKSATDQGNGTYRPSDGLEKVHDKLSC